MAEQIDLTIPLPADPRTTSNLRVVGLMLDWKLQQIIIQLEGESNIRRNFNYSGDVAVTLMTALNKANLSVKSLQKRIIERLITDGKLDGTISGSAD